MAQNYDKSKSDLCLCGTCQNAAERAVAIAEKMISADECPIFITSVGVMLTGFGGSLLHHSEIAGGLTKEAAGLISNVVITNVTQHVQEKTAAGNGERVQFLTEKWEEMIARLKTVHDSENHLKH